MITVTALVWLCNAEKGIWHFLTVPPEQAAEIRFDSVGMRGEFGSVKVEAPIGEVRWTTSLFPDSRTGGYVLPLEADIRRRAGIAARRSDRPPQTGGVLLTARAPQFALSPKSSGLYWRSPPGPA